MGPSSTVQYLIDSARAKLDDKLSDHRFVDDLTVFADGVKTIFQLTNRFLLTAAAGAPADPTAFVNGIAVVATFDTVGGQITFAVPPPAAAPSLVTVIYYFELMEDSSYINFAQDAAGFVGVVPQFSLATDQIGVNLLLTPAMIHYMAAEAAEKMANLSSWYYQANAANKSFNKDQIAAKFQKMGTELMTKAVELRDDVYKRHGKRNAPSFAVTTMGNQVLATPRR